MITAQSNCLTETNSSAEIKTPGVYIIEQNEFSNSIVTVATAVPSFIGYTEKASNGTQPLLNKPFRITSFTEYIQYFVGTHDRLFELSEVTGESIATVKLKLNNTNEVIHL